MTYASNVILSFLDVIPAQAGIHGMVGMDSGLRRSDDMLLSCHADPCLRRGELRSVPCCVWISRTSRGMTFKEVVDVFFLEFFLWKKSHVE